MSTPRNKPLRLLVIIPSWIGDAVMATPALAHLRTELPGAFIGVLVRPGVDQILDGLDLFDEMHVERAHGVFGPKFVAAKVRPRRYDTALLLTNSFSTALVARIAGIPRRAGYDRDGRGFLLTDRLRALKRPGGAWAPVPAVWYYLNLARFMLSEQHDTRTTLGPEWWTELPPVPNDARLVLHATDRDQQDAAEVRARAAVDPDEPIAILNPGGNNPKKRWPEDRFAALADHLAESHSLRVLINGSPNEADLCARIASSARTNAVSLPEHGMSLGALKSLIARAQILVTNDTGPRHVAAALGTPIVSLFGPTDERWTRLPASVREAVLTANPDAPPSELADDNPDSHAIDRISLERVVAAADTMLSTRPARPDPPDGPNETRANAPADPRQSS